MRSERQASGRRLASISRRGFPIGHLDGRRLAFEQLEDRRLLSVQRVGIEAFSGDPQVDFSPTVLDAPVDGQTVQGVKFGWQPTQSGHAIFTNIGFLPNMSGRAIEGDGLGTLSLTFPDPITHLGFDFAISDPFFGSGTVTLIGASGSIVGFSGFTADHHQQAGGLFGNSYGFVGFKASELFTRANFRFNNPLSNMEIGDFFNLDNIRFEDSGPSSDDFDIAAKALQFNKDDATTTLSYMITGADLPEAAEVEFWYGSVDPMTKTTNLRAKAHTDVHPLGTEGGGAVHMVTIAALDMNIPDPTDTHLIAIIDPTGALEETNELNNEAFIELEYGIEPVHFDWDDNSPEVILEYKVSPLPLPLEPSVAIQ